MGHMQRSIYTRRSPVTKREMYTVERETIKVITATISVANQTHLLLDNGKIHGWTNFVMPLKLDWQRAAEWNKLRQLFHKKYNLPGNYFNNTDAFRDAAAGWLNPSSVAMVPTIGHVNKLIRDAHMPVFSSEKIVIALVSATNREQFVYSIERHIVR